MSIAERVARERGESLGRSIGYQVILAHYQLCKGIEVQCIPIYID
jgi:HrpA-like RNA helicase